MNRALTAFFTWPVRRFGLGGRTAVVAGPFVWLLLFFLVPFLLVVKISFADMQLGIPPYTELTSFKDGILHIALDLSHYAFLAQDSLYFATYVNSVVVAAVSTLLCLLLGYPMAYYIARSNPATRNILMMAVMLPFWTSFLIRVYAWIGILKNNGLLNNFLMSIGLIHTPIELYHTNTAVYIGMVYSYLPFLVMPLYAHRVMWNEFFDNADWPMASAVTCAMVLLLLVPMALFQYAQAKALEEGGRR